MSEPSNVFTRINDRIADFVNQPANRRLRPGTGYYSALFRGTLFGLESAADVAERLKTRTVEILWLGTNPNMPSSLANILNPRGRRGLERFLGEARHRRRGSEVILDRGGHVHAALNVSGHASRVSAKELRTVFLPVLLKAADGISSALGAGPRPTIARTASSHTDLHRSNGTSREAVSKLA